MDEKKLPSVGSSQENKLRLDSFGPGSAGDGRVSLDLVIVKIGEGIRKEGIFASRLQLQRKINDQILPLTLVAAQHNHR